MKLLKQQNIEYDCNGRIIKDPLYDRSKKGKKRSKKSPRGRTARFKIARAFKNRG